MLFNANKQPIDLFFKPKDLNEFGRHIETTRSIWVPKSLYEPKETDGKIMLRITAVVRAKSINGLPLNFLIRAQKTVNDLNKWFGILVGSPSPKTYPLPLLVIKELPQTDTDDMHWHT